MLYDKEITQLQEQIKLLELQKDELNKLANKTSDNELLEIYQKEIEETIVDIDEVQEAIAMLKNKQNGSPNGFDEHAQKVDWTNPDNWPQIRGLFGFDDEPREN